MWTYYLKIAWRNLRKNKLFSALNILGLSIGMAVCIVILLFVNYERDFDSIHTKNIYRLNEVQKWEGMVAPQNVALSMYPMGPTLVEEFPEILNFTRVRSGGEMKFQQNEMTHTLSETLWADSSFFQIFDFKMLQGDPATALVKPGSLVLTESTAIQLFGDEPAMGKVLTLSEADSSYFTVTGILADVPENSHLRFDGLTSFSTYVGPQSMENWGGNWLTTYLELVDGSDIDYLESKFPAYLVSHMSEEGAEGYKLFLQSLEDIHANSTDITHDYINYQKFDGAYTRIFFYIALIVLIIAGINFVNLSSAKSINRALEIGVRKASGASRRQLYFQFIAESVLISFIAMFLAVILVSLTLPLLSEFSQRKLELPLFSDPILLGSLLLGALAVGIVSGIYPAVYLSSFQPVKVLKGSVESGKRKSDFRNILVVVQFSCAIFLIISTFFASRQVRYMQEKDLGFSHDQVVTIPINERYSPKYDLLKEKLLSNTLVVKVTGSQQRLGNNLHQTSVNYRGDGPVRGLTTSHVVVDPDYLDVYQMELVAGRNFRDSEADNGKTYIINEALAEELLKESGGDKPLESLVGHQFGFGFNGLDSVGQIVGIVKNFNFNSLHHKIETLALFNQKDWGYGEVSVKIAGDRVPEALAHIESVWNTVIPESEFEYEFLDDHFTELYRADNTVNVIIGMLTILSILISCLGLFGLASFTIEQRKKEIGIRKVLGSSISGVVAMLSTDFIKLVLVAIFIAIPVAWFVVDSWIQDFAYRIDLDWWVFGLAGMVALIIALATVSSQAFKAAMMNPVDSLKSE
jgi:putative ABC transport system permease protein